MLENRFQPNVQRMRRQHNHSIKITQMLFTIEQFIYLVYFSQWFAILQTEPSTVRIKCV